MKALSLDFKKNVVKLLIEDLDDLWYLSSIVEEGDFVKGRTYRKIKLGDESDRKSQVIKKPVFLQIKVEKVEFHKYSNYLRVSGVITQGPEDIPRGSHHTFNVEEGTTLTIKKDHFLSYQRGKIEEAVSSKEGNVLLCVFDREEACFALLNRQGYKLLSTLKGAVEKKANLENIKNTFFQEINKLLEGYDVRYKLNNIVLASPSFWKEYLLKEIKNDSLKKKIALAGCSSGDESAVKELLKRPEIREVLKKGRLAEQTVIVESLLKEISKDNLAVYGIKDVESSVSLGAVDILIVSDEFIHKLRQENNFSVLDNIMRTVDSTKGRILIVDSEFEPGKKVNGLGGVAAILKFKVN